MESRPDEDWSVSRCPGEGGYALLLDYGDAREDLRLVHPSGRTSDLALGRIAAGAFNALGERAEWRGLKTGSTFVPSAMIVRSRIVTNPERPEAPTAVLVVVDLVRGCVAAQVSPGPAQNDQARAIADNIGSRPCRNA